MQMTNYLLSAISRGAAAAAPAGAPPEGAMSPIVTIIPMLLMFVVLYFLMIRPQRKRDKQAKEMRSKIEVGDEIITVGGIVGRVVSLREDTIVVETGSDRSKIRIQRWAIQSNNTVHDDTPSD
jgi:preprotein translocase subunit YajC